MKPFWLAILAGLTLLTALGDSFLNQAGEHKKTNFKLLIGGLIIYLITGLVWFWIYKYVKFSVSGAVYGAMTALVFTAIGIFYFRESLNSIEILGIVLGISSIVLLSRFGS